ncbi:MAG: phospho-sugar mutase [Candidatus Gastranaerophilaceae bacterium]|nr:phospho-sugar mutase [Christensenellales bacterium]
MYKSSYDEWLSALPEGSPLKKELEDIEGDEAAIEERFYRELEFGTAGLRGILGAGTNRMNEYVVRRATRGLAAYLLGFDGAKERGVCIAYDSRRFSKEFAWESARTLSQYGLRVYIFDTLHTVPQLSFTLRELGCIAGIMITASHNPPQYNGYKVYWETGGQMGPKQAEEVTLKIDQFGYFDAPCQYDETLITSIGEDEDEAYYGKTRTLLMHPELLKDKGDSIRVVYTPLHGAGYVPVTGLLNRVGITGLSVVEQQRLPDPDFPTVKVPNPEDRGAFDLAFKLADRVGADVILATDPDSDRLGVAVPADGGYVLLTGNRIGCILINYILSSLSEKGKLPKNALVVKSIVSTCLADAICARYGVTIKSVPTGFRFISELIDVCDRTGEYGFLFGFEESYGFLAGGFARDKDAICAAMLIAEACVYYHGQGKTLYDVLEDIFNEYGFYEETVKSYTWDGKPGMERISRVMSMLRNNPPHFVASARVLSADDFESLESTGFVSGETLKIDMQRMNMIRLNLDGGAWICVRPSGTEPKLKIYIGTSAENMADAVTLGRALMDSMDSLISSCE